LNTLRVMTVLQR